MPLELPNVVVYRQIQVSQDDIIVVTAGAIFAKLLLGYPILLRSEFRVEYLIF